MFYHLGAICLLIIGPIIDFFYISPEKTEFII